MAVTFSTALFAQAAAGTTLFSENFGGYSADDVPNGVVSAAEGIRVIYGDATVTYTSVNGDGTKPGTTKIWAETVAGGTSPEILIGKKGSSGTHGGSLSIAGIPSGGAKVITVSWKQNLQKLTGKLEGKGYSTTYDFPKPTAEAGKTNTTVSFDITVADDADDTFTLTLETGTSNVRVDDILVVVKTAGEGGGESGGGEESKTQKLYLYPTDEWNKDGAQFGIYAFEDGKDPYFSDFMASVVGDAEIFVGTIPEGYTNVIFIRLKADAAAVNFEPENKWNQSVDLELEEGKDQFTILGWEGEGESAKGKGEWSKYAKPVLTDGFYLIGQAGVWDESALSADLLFTVFDENQYKLTVDLEKDQEIKVVEVHRDNILNWYPNGETPNYVVDDDHVGKKKDIYFRPDGKGGEDWFYGFFWTGVDADAHVKSSFEFPYGTAEEKAIVDDQIAANKITDVDGEVTWSIATVVGAGEPTIIGGSSYSLKCLKFGSSGSKYFSKVTFTTDYFKDKKITAVKVNVINNGKKTSTFTAKQGDVIIGTESKEFSNPWVELTVNALKGAGGTLEITYEVEQAFNINYIEVSYEKGGTTAVDNVEESVEAVKTIENGMLIIEKAGVRYNVMGQVIR